MIGHTKVSGPLASFADGFRAELDRLGYTRATREFKLAEVAKLSSWLESRGLTASDVCSARLEEFGVELVERSGRGPTLVAMRPLLAWLRDQGVCGDDPARVPGPLDVLMERYRDWLVNDRQLADRTIDRYQRGARRFLESRFGQAEDAAVLEGLSEPEVTRHLLAEVSRGLSPKSLQVVVAELRSLLRFLYLHEMIDAPLGEGVPAVPGWKDTRVPRPMPVGEVEALLASCDRSTPSGIRDLAVLMLLARMGLRGGEVGALGLDDFDWWAGEVVVHGKGGRYDRMPLPADVGDAVGIYLTEVRPRIECRAALLTLVAPPRPLRSTTIGQIVWRQCRIAGIEPVRSHRLRHTLATELLAKGVTLPEIAQTLRQRDLATTAVYAKVDHATLHGLARPWLVVS